MDSLMRKRGNNVASYLRSLSTALVLTAIAATIWTWGCGKTPQGIVRPPGPTLDRIEIVSSAAELPTGAQVQLIAMAHYSDGSKADVTGQATWATSDEGGVAVSDGAEPPGMVQALNKGSATVSATFEGRQAALDIEITGPMTADVRVDPAMVSMPPHTTARLTATAVYGDTTTADFTAFALWTSNNEEVITVGSGSDAGGIVWAEAPGTAQVTASLAGSLAATSEVIVMDVALQSIEIQPSSLRLPPGVQARLTLNGLFSDGTVVEVGADAAWASSDEAVVTVSGEPGLAGTVTAVDGGSATVTAAFGGHPAVHRRRSEGSRHQCGRYLAVHGHGRLQ